MALHYYTEHPQRDLDWMNTRSILRAIPGIEYIEISNPAALGRHCSSKYINRIGRAAWQQHLPQIMRAAADARVDILATIYHSCHREICHEEANYPFGIVNYVSLLGDAMGIEHADVYKRYKLSGDAQAIYEEVREHVEANGLDREKVRGVVANAVSPSCEAQVLNPS